MFSPDKKNLKFNLTEFPQDRRQLPTTQDQQLWRETFN